MLTDKEYDLLKSIGDRTKYRVADFTDEERAVLDALLEMGLIEKVSGESDDSFADAGPVFGNRAKYKPKQKHKYFKRTVMTLLASVLGSVVCAFLKTYGLGALLVALFGGFLVYCLAVLLKN